MKFDRDKCNAYAQEQQTSCTNIELGSDGLVVVGAKKCEIAVDDKVNMNKQQP